MYDSFDILPILNWHNFLKSGDYVNLLIDRRDKEKYKQKDYIENYENLINSLSKRNILNGFYAKCLQNFLLYKLDNTPINIQNYNDSFFAYLDELQGITDNIIILNKKYSNFNEAYVSFFNQKGYLKALDDRIYDFHYSLFPSKEYKFDLFKDIAIIENITKQSINPSIMSVNHYNAIKKQIEQNNK